MRSETTPAKIKEFLASLGRRVSGAGKIYLTGGASALLIGWRQMTIDIDIKAEPEPGNFFEAIAELKNELDLNIELASPEQFIPELNGWRERSQWIVREQQLDCYHYDFYSQALSKIERAHARDLKDVTEMEKRGLIDGSRVLAFFEEIEPRLIRYPGVNGKMFREKVLQFCSTVKR